MRIRSIVGAVGLLTGALWLDQETVGVARAGDEFVDSVAGVIDGDGPMIAGQSPAPPKRSRPRNRRAPVAPAATPIWEQDGPPIDRAGADGR